VRLLKIVLGIAVALAPVLYCIYFVWKLLKVGGSPGAAFEDGVGPTVLGRGAVGMLFLIPLAGKLIRLMASSGGSGGTPSRAPRAAEAAEGDGLDTDAALARYLTRKAAAGTASVQPSPGDGPPAPGTPRGFGRKVG